MASGNVTFHMKRQEKEITDRVAIDKIIKEANICHLAMVDGITPYVVPLHFGYLDNHLYFHSAPEGRKVDILKKNNRVCFNILADVRVVDLTTKCTTEFKSVIGTGTANLVTDLEEKIRGLKSILRQTLGHEYQIRQDKIESVLLFRIDIREVAGKQSI